VVVRESLRQNRTDAAGAHDGILQSAGHYTNSNPDAINTVTFTNRARTPTRVIG
jgi:hypothetical protein